MRSFYAWKPLNPPGDEGSYSPEGWVFANSVAVVVIALGVMQTLAGLDEGLYRYVPLLLGLVLFGLPHGAIDHLVALGLAGRRLNLRFLSFFVALYLLFVGLMLAWWLLHPMTAAFAFLCMTIYHWGQADLMFEGLGYGAEGRFRSVSARVVHLLLRGLIPIGVPFIAFPDQASEFINKCISIFDAQVSPDWQLWQLLVAVVLTALFLVDTTTCVRRIQHPLATRILIENCVLLGFFLFVSPLIAIGWYFAGWHGFRHILRLAHYQSNDLTGRKTSLVSKTIERGKQAVPFTLAALFLLLGLYFVVQERISSQSEVAALYLVIISALTLPHLIVVIWMDRLEK